MRLAPCSLSAGVIAALLAGCSTPPRPVRVPGPEPALRVMTYNENFGIPADGPTLAAIEAGKADVVFLQEVNTGWERALRLEPLSAEVIDAGRSDHFPVVGVFVLARAPT
jgi:endonuclease/exonuclease/phosphatase (EEP) superfamily protein YafD